MGYAKHLLCLCSSMAEQTPRKRPIPVQFGTEAQGMTPPSPHRKSPRIQSCSGVSGHATGAGTARLVRENKYCANM